MIPIPFNENRFSFLFFVFFSGHLLVGQLCINPKSDRSLLSCLKVTQCSTSAIGDAPQYNSCPLPIQVMTTEPLPAPSKCKSGLPQNRDVHRVMKTKFPVTVMVFGVVSSESHIIPPSNGYFLVILIICLYTFKWFQLGIFNSNNSTYHLSCVSVHLKWFRVFMNNTNNPF